MNVKQKKKAFLDEHCFSDYDYCYGCDDDDEEFSHLRGGGDKWYVTYTDGSEEMFKRCHGGAEEVASQVDWSRVAVTDEGQPMVYEC